LLKTYTGLAVVLTGGDAPLLANHLKYRIFAEPLLVHYGLIHCLNLNEL
jgi:pantothenate kinase type III